MAKIDIRMPKGLLLKVSKLGNKTDEIIGSSLKIGGQILLSNVKSNLQSVIGKDVKFEKRSTNELNSSLGVSPVDIDNNGVHNVKIGFNEPRRKQYAAKSKRSYYTITNAMIANVIEYGKSGQSPKPFLKPAKSKSRRACIEAMKANLESEMNDV